MVFADLAVFKPAERLLNSCVEMVGGKVESAKYSIFNFVVL